MRVLSIDPGSWTGIAVLTDAVELTMTVQHEKIYGNGFLNHLVLISKPDVVIIEDYPLGQPNLNQVALVNHIESWFKTAGYRVEKIQPVRWKNLIARVEIPGVHARDAATMASWWIENEARKTDGNTKR